MKKNDIIEIYSKLSGGKLIENDNYIISRTHFSSLLYDRFIVELKKRNINWDGSNITYSNLVNSNFSNEVTTVKYVTNLNTNEYGVGIDIQDINELPDCNDYWEDEFYKSKFTSKEIGYCLQKDNIKQSFAGIYSIKESILKSNNCFIWEDIEIMHNEFGKPYFDTFNISISHSSNYVVTIAIKNVESKQIDSEIILSENTLIPQKKSNPNIIAYAILIIFNIALLTYVIIKEFFNV